MCLTVQMALTDPGCILSMDKLVAAASHQFRWSHVHVVANSGGGRKKGNRVKDLEYSSFSLFPSVKWAQ